MWPSQTARSPESCALVSNSAEMRGNRPPPVAKFCRKLRPDIGQLSRTKSAVPEAFAELTDRLTAHVLRMLLARMLGLRLMGTDLVLGLSTVATAVQFRYR